MYLSRANKQRNAPHGKTSTIIMLKIYENKEQIPEALLEYYAKRSDGRYEPQVEGINSILGLTAKRDELLEKVKEIPALKTRVSELETVETLPAGKIAADKKEFDALKTENEAYRSLGTLEEVKPKLEGYDALKTETETNRRNALLDEAFGYAGVKNKKTARDLRQSDSLNIETETVDGVKKFYNVSTDDKGKPVKTEFNSEYLKTADGFKEVYSSLFGTDEDGVRFPVQKFAKDGKTASAAQNTMANRYAGTVAAVNKK